MAIIHNYIKLVSHCLILALYISRGPFQIEPWSGVKLESDQEKYMIYPYHFGRIVLPSDRKALDNPQVLSIDHACK